MERILRAILFCWGAGFLCFGCSPNKAQQEHGSSQTTDKLLPWRINILERVKKDNYRKMGTTIEIFERLSEGELLSICQHTNDLKYKINFCHFMLNTKFTVERHPSAWATVSMNLNQKPRVIISGGTQQELDTVLKAKFYEPHDQILGVWIDEMGGIRKVVMFELDGKYFEAWIHPSNIKKPYISEKIVESGRFYDKGGDDSEYKTINENGDLEGWAGYGARKYAVHQRYNGLLLEH